MLVSWTSFTGCSHQRCLATIAGQMNHCHPVCSRNDHSSTKPDLQEVNKWPCYAQQRVHISRVPDQNGISQACYIVQIHHSGSGTLNIVYSEFCRVNSVNFEWCVSSGAQKPWPGVGCRPGSQGGADKDRRSRAADWGGIGRERRFVKRGRYMRFWSTWPIFTPIRIRE